jgi:hypothetical protein
MDKVVRAQFALILMESKLCDKEPETAIYDNKDVEDFMSHRMRFVQVPVGVVFDIISPTANSVNQTTCQRGGYACGLFVVYFVKQLLHHWPPREDELVCF